MIGPGGALPPYKVFSDSARTSYWGGTQGDDTVSGTRNGAAQAVIVHGRIAGAQYVAPGDYTDTITCTLYS
jgi:spore coat protein U-like protein